MTIPEGALHRAPRPLIGWLGVLTGLASLAFLILLAIPILRAVNRWADGEHVDWSGFALILTAASAAAGTILTQVAQWMQTRSRERRDQIAWGSAPERPFDPSATSQDGSDIDGPRPAENRE